MESFDKGGKFSYYKGAYRAVGQKFPKNTKKIQIFEVFKRKNGGKMANFRSTELLQWVF